MRILGISGSLRRGSHNRRLLQAASTLLPPGVELVEWDNIAGIPAFDEDLETTPPEPVLEFFRAIEDADALLIATPEYNASLPGALKNALDWASRPFPENVLRNKPAAVDRREHRPVRRRVGAGRGAQGAQGLRRAPARVRAPGRPRRLRVRGRRQRSTTPSSPNASRTSSPTWCGRSRPRSRRDVRAPAVRRRSRASGPTRRATASGSSPRRARSSPSAGIDGVSMEDVAKARVRRHRHAVPALRRPRRARLRAARRADQGLPERADLRAAAARPGRAGRASGCTRSARASSTCWRPTRS